MTKRQLISEIRRRNVAVPPRFLAQFDPASLRQYLDHLKSAQEVAKWKRPQLGLRAVC